MTFVVSAFVTLCAAVLGMFTAPFAALVKGSLCTTQSQKQPTLFSSDDNGWIMRIAKYDTVLQSLVLSFSDQQLITGLSILIVAFNQHCTISTYHFGIVIDIACFSTITHLASLFSLRVFFQERVFLRWLRMSGMTAILIMIIAGTIIRNQSQFSDALTCPVQCSIDKMSETTYSPRFTAGVIILSLEYLFVLPMMSKSLMHGITSKITRHMTIPSSQKMLTQSRSQDKPVRFIDLWRDVRVITLWWRFWLEMIGPMAIMGLTGNAIWLLVLAVKDRSPSGIEVNGTNTQNVWSFGQLLAVFTLVLPLLNVIEAYQGESHLYMKSLKLIDSRYGCRKWQPTKFPKSPTETEGGR